MTGETNLAALLKSMNPVLNEGEYVFCEIQESDAVDLSQAIYIFREKEGLTIVTKKEYADQLGLKYSFVSSWITLTIHSSLEAIGLTAEFTRALTEAKIACNVVAAYYHDHIFVAKKDGEPAMKVLLDFQKSV